MLGNIQLDIFDNKVRYVRLDGTEQIVSSNDKSDNRNKECVAMLHKYTDAKYAIKSAFHKEVRRSDYERGMAYAKWFARLHGQGALKWYILGIVFEETKNIDLLMKIRNRQIRGIDAASMLLRSVKKYELECRKNVFLDYLFGYRDAAVNVDDKNIIRNNIRCIEVADCLREAFNIFWKARLYDKRHKTNEMFDLLASEMRDIGHKMGKWGAMLANDSWAGLGRLYPVKTLIEMMFGVWDESCNVLRPVGKIENELIYYEMPDYVFDNHTRRGKNLLRNTFFDIVPGKPMPKGVDLRWSGLIRGVVWREFAYQQFGKDMIDKPWEDVNIPGDVWDAVDMLDRYFYERFYKSIQ